MNVVDVIKDSCSLNKAGMYITLLLRYLYLVL